jgi:hypothetical protein
MRTRVIRPLNRIRDNGRVPALPKPVIRPNFPFTLTDLSYAAASRVAPAVHAHFAHHLEEARARGERDLASLPSEHEFATVLDAAFWTSLRREEGYVPRLSIAFATPQQAQHPIVFEQPVQVESPTLAHIAPAVERPGIHLGIAPGGPLRIWGATRSLPRHCCVIEVAEAGLVVVKHHRGDALAKFVNVAVLQGEQIKIIDEHASSLPDCPDLLASLLGFDSPSSWAGSVNVLVQLAVSIRAHRRGGLLLLVPKATGSWRQSIVHPMRHEIAPAYNELAMLSRTQQERAGSGRAEHAVRSWHEELGRAVDAIAGLTAIDGATVLSSEYELLAFGVKIARRRGAAPVEQLTVTEPVIGAPAAVIQSTQLGGTRHLSAAQFIHDQHDALALVASQDGGFTVLAWSPCEGMVHAHRVETLLL